MFAPKYQSQQCWKNYQTNQKYSVPVKHAWEWDDEDEEKAKDDDEAAEDLGGGWG